MRIIFTSANSGGHIFPIIAVASYLKKQYSKSDDLQMYFLGPKGVATESLEAEDIKIKNIISGKFRRYFSVWSVVDFFKIPISFIQSLYHLFVIMPDVVFSKGGYGSIPIVFVAWIYRIPIIIHESDTIPGLANKITSKLANRIAVSFDTAKEELPSQKTILTGNPIRKELVDSCQPTDNNQIEEAKTSLNIKTSKPIILIIGGSQGAYKINEIVFNVLKPLSDKYEIIHQCGKKNYSSFSELVKQTFGNIETYHLFPFLNQKELANTYLISDLIISRAGAGSIFEISACHKPSILIPLPESANNHQRKNAFVCARLGMSIVLEQANLTPNLFLNEINKIIENKEAKQKMIKNTDNLSYPQAAQNIANALIEMSK